MKIGTIIDNYDANLLTLSEIFYLHDRLTRKPEINWMCTERKIFHVSKF